MVLAAFALLVPGFAHAGWITETINGFFYSIAFMAGGMFVTIGGLALDMALNQLVFGMGELMQGGIGASVNTVWIIVRDGFNLLFIFGLIYIGLRLIWDSDDSGTKRALGNLIIAALLINFSLFIAKFVVDFSNIAAVQIYNLMAATLEVNGAGGNAVADFWAANSGGIPAYVMHLVGMQTVASSVEGGFGLAVMIFIFLVFTGLVFLAGALMIVTRFVMLCFYMIFSPVMFLGMILPKLKSHQDKWWDNFLKQAFFAPAYLFCVYIALRTLAAAQAQLTGGGQFGENMEGLAGREAGFIYDATTGQGFGAILFLIVALGFMIAAVLVANRMSIHGAATSMIMIKGARSRMQRMAGSATAGGAAALSRNTAGRLAYNQSQDKDFRAKMGSSWSGRQVLKATDGIADSSFDVRRAKVGGKAVGAQLDIGEGKKGGFKTTLKEKQADDENFAKQLGKVDDSDPLVQARIKEKAELDKRLKQVKDEADTEKTKRTLVFDNDMASFKSQQDTAKDDVKKASAESEKAQAEMKVAFDKMGVAQQEQDPDKKAALVTSANAEIGAAQAKLAKAQEDEKRLKDRVKELDIAMKERREVKVADDETAKRKTNEVVQKIEKDINQATVNIENERNRYVLGSTFTKPEAQPELDELKAKVTAKDTEIAEEWKKYHAASDATAQANILKVVKTKDAELAALKNLEQNARARASVTGPGFAASMDSRGQRSLYQRAWTKADKLTSSASLVGAQAHYEYLGNQSADNLRSKYAKQAKMSQEEKQNATMVDALKASKA